LPIYPKKWTLTTDEDRRVYPETTQGFVRTIQLQQGQQFYRQNLGKIVFRREDCDYILSKTFGIEYFLKLEEYISGAWVEKWYGVFTLLDCEIDEDERMISVKPDTEDPYKEVLDIVNREFNIAQIVSSSQDIEYSLIPLLQIYILDSLQLTNYIGGAVWQQDLLETAVTEDELTSKYGFVKSYNKIYIPGNATVLTPDVSGIYDGTTLIRDSDSKYGIEEVDDIGQFTTSPYPTGHDKDDSDLFSIWEDGNTDQWVLLGFYNQPIEGNTLLMYQVSTQSLGAGSGTLTHVSGATNTSDINYDNFYDTGGHSTVVFWGIKDLLAGGTPWVYFSEARTRVQIHPEPWVGSEARGTPFTSRTTSSKCRAITYFIYTRVLTNSSTFDTVSTDLLTEEDIVAVNENYKRVIAHSVSGFFPSSAHQTARTLWGRYSEDALNFADEYFVEPSESVPHYAIDIKEWRESSIWFGATNEFHILQFSEPDRIILKDAYKLSEVVGAIVSEFTDNITHTDIAACSDFFYGTSNAIRDGERMPVIVPKSNIVVVDYDHPATEANIRLADIFEMLKNVFNVYWYIDSSNRLVLEHLSFFDNGKDYTTPQIGLDLTTLTYARTGRKWEFKTNKYRYDRQQLPEIIKWDWSEKVSDAFTGFDIEATDLYIEKGLVETRDISRFTTDINVLLANSEEAGLDGFVLLDVDTATDKVPIKVVDLTGNRYWILQNGFLSFVYLHPNYFKHGLPSTNVKINDVATTATTEIRGKIQEMEVAVVSEPDPMELVKTTIGDGRLKKLDITLETGAIKITINHDTD
jgi:hypothetical protein